MSHHVKTMAFAGEVPWHGLGVRVSDDIGTQDMMKAAGLDWEVKLLAASAKYQNKHIPMTARALIRADTGVLLTEVTKDWHPVQNAEAFKFFEQFVKDGDLKMHTAGALHGGRICWVLAQTQDTFEVVKGDEVNGFVLFVNPFQYGKGIQLCTTATRVVCWNTMSEAMHGPKGRQVRVNHRKPFDADEVKTLLGISGEQRAAYRDAAKFLAKTRCEQDRLLEFFDAVFPKTSESTKAAKDEDAKHSKNAKRALEILDTQPGANFGKGTWWNAFNAVTYLTDHEIGKSQDNRVQSSLMGYWANRKQFALQQAVNFAKKAA
jgi:phage/plasmid-like protein (TIGR03299 family)